MNYFILLFTTIIIIQAFYTLIIMTYAWKDEDEVIKNNKKRIFIEPKLSFTLILPARNEELVIADTLLSLANIDYPKNLYEIIVALEPDDNETYTIAKKTIDNKSISNARVLITDKLPKGKPTSLNESLKVAKGEVICIIDAEDEVSSRLLSLANTTMVAENSDVLQGGVQLMNYNSQWFSTLSILEYFFWFKSSLHYFANCKIIPLGGNTVFIKKQLLIDCGGWDQYCLTEDADLGVRLSVKGAKISVVYDENNTTKEETPEDVKSYIKQRTRWIQGFYQIFMKGDWLKLKNFNQKFQAIYFLLWPLFQIMITYYFIISLLFFPFLKLNLFISLYSAIPLFLLLIQIGFLIIGLWMFTRAYNLKFYWYLPLKVIVFYFPYQVILSIASVRALYREIRGDVNWEKTAHKNIHREKFTSYEF
jgi:glycosyltransferase XagB